MPHDRILPDATAKATCEFTVGTREAIMLPHVFIPRTHNKCFQVSIGSLDISANPPTRRSVAAPYTSIFAYVIEELRFVARRNLILHRDQYRMIGIGLNRRKAPMVPGRQIGSNVGHPQKQRRPRAYESAHANPKQRRPYPGTHRDRTPDGAASGNTSLEYQQ